MSQAWQLLKLLSVGAWSVALLAAAWAAVRAGAVPPERLGVRGLKRRQALRSSITWSITEPVVRWLGARASRLLGEGPRRQLDAYLLRSGQPLGLSAGELVALSLLSFGAGLGGGAASGALLGMGLGLGAVAAPLAAAVPYLLLSHARTGRDEQIRRGLPDVLELLSLAMSAGLDFQGALRQLVEKSSDPQDALVGELGCILHELKLGRTRQQALHGFGERVLLDCVAQFVGAVAQAEQRGAPLTDVLRTQASVARFRRTVKAEEAASRAGVQMIMPLILVFLCIMLLVLGPMLLSLSTPSGAGGAFW